MSIQADIDATVEAFVGDLADLVRRVAIQAARTVLEAGSERYVAAAAAAPPRPRPSRKPLPKPAPRSVPVPAAAAAPPAPPPRSLKDPRRGRLITLPASSPPPPIEQPLPVVVKVPAKLPRKPRTPKAASVPPPPIVAAEPQPARNWVVVRRPAKDRGAPGSDAPATASNGEADAAKAGNAAPAPAAGESV